MTNGHDVNNQVTSLHTNLLSPSYAYYVLNPGFAAKGYLAIALDMPGHGQSYRLEKEPDLAALSEGALAAVKAFGLDGPVDYVGHHTGTGVCLWVSISFFVSSFSFSWVLLSIFLCETRQSLQGLGTSRHFWITHL